METCPVVDLYRACTVTRDSDSSSRVRRNEFLRRRRTALVRENHWPAKARRVNESPGEFVERDGFNYK